MIVRLNGEEREIDDGATLRGLLVSYNIKEDGIAVDINREVVPRRRFGDTIIKEGDVIEIIRMVGGG